MVVIVALGVGNIGSLEAAFRRLGVAARVSAELSDVARASALVLPGVGSFAAGAAGLARPGLLPILRERIFSSGVPLLGVCLGLHLLGESSEEGPGAGLGWIDGVCRRLAAGRPGGPKVPHMGWNRVSRRRPSLLLRGVDPDARFYFSHSYRLCCREKADVAAQARHQGEIDAVVEKGRLFGVQFHPERSHEAGLAVLRNFLELRSC